MADPARDPTISRSSPDNHSSQPSQAQPPLPRNPPPGATSPPAHVTSTPPKIYEVFHSPSSPAPPASANSLPEGSGQNTAGSREKAPSLGDAVKTVRLEDFKQVHMYPCVRESLLMGIGAGAGLGGVRALWGGEFAVLIFCLVV